VVYSVTVIPRWRRCSRFENSRPPALGGSVLSPFIRGEALTKVAGLGKAGAWILLASYVRRASARIAA